MTVVTDFPGTGRVAGVLVVVEPGTKATSVVDPGPDPPPVITEVPMTTPATSAATTAVVDQALRSGSRVIRGASGRRANVSANRDES
ncbi:hypothetical protein OG474_18335 [Kribbella sp. NBC_01505]|uniref:hypothetical protein n=1 Tax=Kribbella sp. NBC_01505 TaxID=2903580 RepID=UPI003866C382